MNVNLRWAVVGLMAVAGHCQAAQPVRPIAFVVPFSSGTTKDVNARGFAHVRAAIAGHPVLLKNRAGAQGRIANRDQ